MPQGLQSISLPTTLPGATLPAYGHDLSCTTDLDPNMLEVDGLTALSQALFRRIITPRGTLIDDPNYGFDVTQFLNDDLAQNEIGRVGSGVDAEFLKDERVVASTTTVSLALGVMTVASLVTPSVGPTFRLVIGVTAVSSTILQAAA